MKATVISIWICVIIVTSGALGFTWYETHHLTPEKLAIINRLLLRDHQIINNDGSNNKSIAVLGTSLVVHGFAADKITTDKLHQQNIAVSFHRFNILSASPSELEAALLTITDQKIDLILVDITPWLISFGFGERFTHHRHWLTTRISEKLNFRPHRYDQRILSNEAQLSNNYSNNADKFKRFKLKQHRLSDKVTNAINNSTAKIRFYLPAWAKEAHISFGMQQSKKLIANSISFAKRYQVPLLSGPPQMAKTYYTDLVHVNRKGRQEYFQWLIKTVKQQQ